MTVYSITAGTSAASEANLQHLLDTATAGSVINLSAGTFHFSKSLTVTRSDITLEGAGSGKTVIMSEMASPQQTLIIQSPDLREQIATVAQTATAGARTVKLSSVSDLKVGDILYLAQENDRAWLDATGNSYVPDGQ